MLSAEQVAELAARGFGAVDDRMLILLDIERLMLSSEMALTDNPVQALIAHPDVVARVVADLLAPFALAGGAR